MAFQNTHTYVRTFSSFKFNYFEFQTRKKKIDKYLKQAIFFFADFFQLPSTQIATQSCLMDTEEAPQQQQQQHEMLQQQVDEAMFENNNNIVKYEENNNRQLENVQTLTHQNQQHNQQHSQQHLVQTQQPTQQQQSNVYHHHHQQHYQGHLHRANRDVSRCMLSHMI